VLRVEGVTGAEPLRLVGPDGAEWTPAQRTVPGGVVLEVEEAVTAPGVYDVMQGEALLRRVAVNLDPRESDLAALTERAARERLAAATGAEVRVLDAAGGAGLAAAERLRAERAGVELWNVFLALALAFLVAEMLVAMRWKPETASAGSHACPLARLSRRPSFSRAGSPDFLYVRGASGNSTRARTFIASAHAGAHGRAHSTALAIPPPPPIPFGSPFLRPPDDPPRSS